MKYPEYEHCPECGTETAAIDVPAVKYDDVPDFWVRLERFDCGKCGWRWANPEQRHRNGKLYAERRALSRMR